MHIRLDPKYLGCESGGNACPADLDGSADDMKGAVRRYRKHKALGPPHCLNLIDFAGRGSG
jgi:hypothetical protein